MAVTNLLKSQIDQPVYEWCRFAPFTASALSAFAYDEYGVNKYIYAIAGTAFWRYDTVSDSWQELGSPQIAGTVVSAMTLDPMGGAIGEPISATSNTITVGGLLPGNLVGMTIRITSGTGAGQTRTITSVSDPIIADNFIVSAGTVNYITDSTKRWKPNQWKNYSIKTRFGPSAGSVRRILYNDPVTLYFADTGYQPYKSWNVPFLTAPTALGVTGTIESLTLTVDSPWTTVPDENSRFQVLGGVVWLASSAGSASGIWMQAYDIATDTWYTKSSIGHSFNGSFATDLAIEHISESAGAFVSNASATSVGNFSLTNSTASMTLDTYRNCMLKIMSGPGAGQTRRITSNSATTFYTSTSWDLNPTSASTYSVFPDYDKIFLVGNAASFMWQYSIEGDIWFSAPYVDHGIVRSAAAKKAYTPASGVVNMEPLYGITGVTYYSNGITGMTISAGGSGYYLNDLVTISGGTGGQAFVTGVDSTGAVTAIEMANLGNTYTAGLKTTTGGTGTGLQITITIGAVGLVGVYQNHCFVNLQSVTLSGLGNDYSWNGTWTIYTSGYSSFYVIAPYVYANGTIASANTANYFYDLRTRNIDYFYKTVLIIGNGPNPSFIKGAIANATAASGAFQTAIGGAIPTNNATRYVLQEMDPFGKINLAKTGKEAFGRVSSSTSTTLTDSSKTWDINQYAGAYFQITSGPKVYLQSSIVSNTGNTLTLSGSFGATLPDSESTYAIFESAGTASASNVAGAFTDNKQKWPTNSLVGKRIRFTGGTGAYGTDYSITSNSSTGIVTSGGQSTATDTVYHITDVPAKATGMIFVWLGGLSNSAQKGRKLLLFRGGGSALYDIYDITTNQWELAPSATPTLTTTFTGGSMYCYDGGDNVYITKEATGRVYKLNLADKTFSPCSTTPYAHGTATIGNRMAMIKTSDGLRYLYIMRHSGSEMWRTLVFW
jgi:hypothetical protein